MEGERLLRQTWIALAITLFFLGCDGSKSQQVGTGSPPPASPTSGASQGDAGRSLKDARQGFNTRLVRRESAHEPIPQPPPSLFTIVRYDAPVGKLAAYLSPDPSDGSK